MFKKGECKAQKLLLFYCNLFIAISTFYSDTLFCFQGFTKGTIVKVPNGYKPIEEIQRNDTVIAFSKGNYFERDVLEVFQNKIPYFYLVYIGNQVIGIAPNQKLYIHEKDEWIELCSLSDNSTLFTKYGALYIDRIVRVDEEVDVFDLMVSRDHNFCITDYDIVVHNFFPFVLALGSIAGFAVELAFDVSLLGLLAAIFGAKSAKDKEEICIDEPYIDNPYILCKNREKKKPKKVEESSSKKTTQSPNPENDPDDDSDDKKKKRYDDKVNNIYELLERVGFGKDLKAGSVPDRSSFDGTRILRIVQNMPKYGLLKGFRVYLDNLHKNHLEVFNKVGNKLLKVLNLDGTENAQKLAAATMDQARNIKKCVR